MNLSSSSSSLYQETIITKRICVLMSKITKQFNEQVLNILIENFEGKCDTIGYIKPKSIEIISRSNGEFQKTSDQVLVDVQFKCLVCNPVIDQIIICKIISIDMVQYVAVVNNEEPSPIIFYILHNNKIQENIIINDIVEAKILGTRFEYRSSSITAIGEFIKKINI